MSRCLQMHLRARGVPLALVGVAGLCAGAWVAAAWLAGHPWFGGAVARVPVVALAPVLAAVVALPGLAGADEALERTTALPWPRWRAVHWLAALAVATVGLSLAVLVEPATFGAVAMVRNTAGYLGLAALLASLAGARVAWAPLCAYAAVVYMAAPRTPGGLAAVWAWPVQPDRTLVAFATATALAAGGLAVYARTGARAAREP